MFEDSFCPSCAERLSSLGTLTLSNSPVAHLLSCEIYPDFLESIQVQKIVADAEQDLSSIEGEIIRVERLSTELKTRKQQLVSFKEAHEAVIAPIRRVPDDILVEIFMHCIPPWREAIPSLKDAPLVLQRVCWRWRTLVAATPTLWTCVSLVAGRQSVLHWAEMFMSFSAQCPVNIALSCHRPEACRSMMKIILPHSNRWRKVSFLITSQMVSMLSSVRGRLSSLEFLDVDVAEFRDTPNIVDIDYFGAAPRLAGVELGAHLSPDSFVLPWSQFTSFSGHIGPPKMLMLSKMSRRLASADVILKDDGFTRHVLEAVTDPLDSLKSLRLAVDDALCTITLQLLPPYPALDEFNLEASFQCSSSPLPIHLKAFLRMSGGQLTKLTLDFKILSDNDLLSCLRHTPRVVELKIRDSSGYAVTDSLMKGLTKKESECILPRLKSLFLSGDLQVSDRSLVPMIYSRWHRSDLGRESMLGEAGCDEQIVVDYSYRSSYLTPTLVARLLSLRHDGFPVRLLTYGKDFEVHYLGLP